MGEATITFQDVEVLYGLPVNSNPVLGIEQTRDNAHSQSICAILLGFTPVPGDIKYSCLKVSALNTHMQRQLKLPDMKTQDIVNQIARCCMFLLIAGTLMADTSVSYLKLMYLPMLKDVNAIGSYRCLCKASQGNQHEIARFLPLLQVWVWERVTVLRPQIVAQRDTQNIFLLVYLGVHMLLDGLHVLVGPALPGMC
ncbi:serine/threonine-protein phosphatase 7 long form homolog [Lycium barbarum]|uniref:serine/threonine-protein phosphatase 7 long form homolog n=1 Tax=Lycium barbarum TaxID=112863 RepID=UPI00293EEFA3|nr:serine/threonine-protein phosphatase 7 long form homolog [Lycium barbarum]